MNLSSLLASFASAFKQDQRLLSLKLGDDEQWDGVLLPQSVDGREAISDSFRYTVDCLSANGNLPLKNLLGLPARLTISDQNGEPMTRGGVVTSAQLAGSDGGFSRYQLVIQPAFALLKMRQTSRVFQDISVPDIVKQILNEHQANNPVLARHQSLQTQLQRSYPLRSYAVQYRQSDYDFIVRLLHESGIAWRFEHVTGSTVQSRLVLFDDPQNLPAAQQQHVRFHRSDATEAQDSLTEWASSHQIVPGQVSLQSFDYKTVTALAGSEQSAINHGKSGLAAQSTLEHYEPQTHYFAADSEKLADQARLYQQALDSQAKSFSGSGTMRGLQAGHWFELTEHPAHDGDRREQRQFAISQLQFRARNNLPSDLTRQLPQSLLASNASSDDAPFQTSITTQRRGLPLTPAYSGTEHAKPTVPGVQTATVVGPVGEEVHCDESGRIKVQFHWARSQEHPDVGANFDERSSCWIRVAMPSAGAGWGHAFIPRIGQEVIVDFVEGDVDRPIVTGVLYNGNHPTPNFSGAGNLPGNKTLSGIKSKEHQGDKYNELLFDDTTGQVRAKLSSEHAKSQLNLGYLAHPRQDGKAEPRGEGAEMRSDASIAIRAAQGLLLTTYGRVRASGNQLARDEMIQLLDQCAELFKSFGDYASSNQALPLDPAAQTELIDHIKGWEKGSNTDNKAAGGGQPVISLTAQDGLSVTAAKGILGYAGLNLDLGAKQHLQFTAGQRYSVNAGQGISLFAQSGDLRQIAHQGQMLLQAQANDIRTEAEKNVRIMAINGEVLIHAPTIRLVSQDGAFIKIDSDITLGTAGTVHIKAANKAMQGPATDSVASPNFQSGPTDQKFQLHYPGGDPAKPQIAAHREYEITLKDGSKLTGKADAQGKTKILNDSAMQIAHINILPKKKR